MHQDAHLRLKPSATGHSSSALRLEEPPRPEGPPSGRPARRHDAERKMTGLAVSVNHSRGRTLQSCQAPTPRRTAPGCEASPNALRSFSLP